jgi:hypothetical protein
MSYEVGSAFLQIIPSFSGMADAIDAEAAKWGNNSGTTFSDTFKAKVDAALANLKDVSVNADTTEAMAKIAEIRSELETLSGEKIGIDISEAEALTKIEALKVELDEVGAKHPEIRVSVDAAQAELELAAVAATSDAAGASLGGLGGSGNDAGTGLGALGADAEASGEQVGALIPLFAGLAAAIVPLGGLAAGAFAAMPAMIAGATSALGALYLGFSGIPAAISAFSNVPSSGTGASPATALANANAERVAADSVQKAYEALNNSRINGARSVQAAETAAANAQAAANQRVLTSEQTLVNAEHTLTQAQYNEQQAQNAVITARQNAQDQLNSYTNQLADASISMQQAQLDVTNAKIALDQALQPGSTATLTQQDQAKITYEAAVQRVKDLQTTNGVLTRDAAAAQAAGVDGNVQVLAAEHQLVLAQQSVVDATTAQQTAINNVNSAEAAAAKQQITDATNITIAKQKAAQGVSDAERNVTIALDNQANAYARAALPSSVAISGMQAYQKALNNLTPAGRRFVEFVTGTMYPVFQDFKGKVQEAFLPLIQTGLQDLFPFFKDMQPIILQAAKGIGQTFDELAKFIGSKTGLKEVMDIFKLGNDFMNAMGGNMVTIFEAVTSIGSQSGPIIKVLADGITSMVNDFAKWAEGGGFQKFMVWLQQNGPMLATALLDVVVAAGKLIVALSPIGTVLDVVVGFVATLVGWLVQTWQIFSEVLLVVGGAAVILSMIFDPINWIVIGLSLMVAGLLDIAAHWSQVWGGIQSAASATWAWLDNNLFSPIATFFTKTIPDALDTVATYFHELPGKIVTALGDFGAKVWSVFMMPVDWLTTNVGAPIVNFFKGLPDEIATLATNMWHGISDAFKDVLNTIIGWWDSLHFHIPGFSLGPVHFGGFDLGMPNIPKFHDGGVVQGAPGVEQLALLMPGEIVTPAGMPLPASGGGGMHLELNIHGADLSNVAAIERIVVQAFSKWTESLTPMRLA